ncbi:polysaccharide lyase family 14 protein [Wolfiporia cocos MD-104 SS10]|uniref:Polysaccharide lyase family 14 protein n=1 Tax=Wolfiporia cocos (strain MD-104) TaxID=742152 RepID=A0A2H3J9H4_WOLCO|nr:polysaccharide lyase family 14 protein [Wolfiporia cocos MD-104 SS10]
MYFLQLTYASMDFSGSVLVLLLASMRCLAVPLDSESSTTVQVVWVTDVVSPSPSQDPTTATALIDPYGFVTSLLFFPGSSQSSVSSTPTVTVTETQTGTITATLTDPPSTITISAAPVTVTDFVTISPQPPPAEPLTAWRAPSTMTDLAAFNITNFASGQQNLHVFNGIPIDISAVTLSVMSDVATNQSNASIPVAPLWDNSSAVMQLFYPANSINPAQEPQGGADFYATPLDLHHAQNVSLEYSVFFPIDFDWVQGGKLPGIYGGHTGCSGGDAAKTCFSTRLMWRSGGAGELYLYAPKDKQTQALCTTPPKSVCDAAYGLSVGRGSFNFTAGGWTRVRQTVSLNTPGQQDGGFVLEVDGQPVINRSDVYYRDAVAAPQPSGSGGDDGDPDGSSDDDSGDDSSDGSSGEGGDGGDGDDGDDGGLLGGLGSILGGNGGLLGNAFVNLAYWPERGVLMMRDGIVNSSLALLPSPTAFVEGPVTDAAASAILAGFMSTLVPSMVLSQGDVAITTTVAVPASPVTQTVIPYVTSTSTVYPTATPTDITMLIEEAGNPEPVPFTGLFFSTFFGGHEPEYATPKDQYAWFQDFSMTINS